ncbi:MAG: HD domain-containing protein [Anaerofustis sp.]
MDRVLAVNSAMINYYRNDPKRMFHFTKVHALCRYIGMCERIDEATAEILEIAALTHDIGIKNSEIKYQSAAGNYQQTEGPPEAEALLKTLGIPSEIMDRVSYLIAHHHTYKEIDGIDYQILIEADFLVNAYEEGLKSAQIESMRKLFRTETGLMLLGALYS